MSSVVGAVQPYPGSRARRGQCEEAKDRLGRDSPKVRVDYVCATAEAG